MASSSFITGDSWVSGSDFTTTSLIAGGLDRGGLCKLGLSYGFDLTGSLVPALRRFHIYRPALARISVRLEELSVRDEGSTDMKLNPAGAESEADIGGLVRRVDWVVRALGVNGTGLSILL